METVDELLVAINSTENVFSKEINHDSINWTRIREDLIQDPSEALVLNQLYSHFFGLLSIGVERYYKGLEDLHGVLGFSQDAAEIIGIIWANSLLKRPKEEQLKFFSYYASDDCIQFHSLSRSLPQVIKVIHFETEEAEQFFINIERRLGHDLARSGYVKSVKVYCNHNSHDAIILLRSLLQKIDIYEQRVAGLILGQMRIATRSKKYRQLLQEVEKKYAHSPSIDIRRTYYNSWLTTINERELNVRHLESIREVLKNNIEDDLEIVFIVLLRIYIRKGCSDNAGDQIREWLSVYAIKINSENTKIEAVHWIATIMDLDNEDVGWLLLEIPPMMEYNDNIWGSISRYFISLHSIDRERFRLFFLRYALHEGKNMLVAIKKNRSWNDVFNLMKRDGPEQYVVDCLLADLSSCRQIAMLLFEKTEITTLKSEVNRFDRRTVSIAHNEAVRSTWMGMATGIFLLCLHEINKLQGRASEESLLEDIFMESINYPGKIQSYLESCTHDRQINGILRNVKWYFLDNKYASAHSQICMAVPFHEEAELSWRAKFADDVHSAAMEGSILQLVAKEIRYLYGNSFGYISSAALMPSIPSIERTFSQEVPRIEFIDPEQMTLRRYAASIMLSKLNIK
jgi:hypothetical protein